MSRGGESGVTTVEFALVFPLFLILVSIAAYFGWWAYVQSQVDQAASRAARYAAVPTSTGTYDYCPSSIRDTLNHGLVADKVTAAEVTVSTRSGTVTDTTCPAATPPTGYVRVSIAHHFTNPFTWFLGVFTGTSGQLVVTGSGQARVESP